MDQQKVRLAERTVDKATKLPEVVQALAEDLKRLGDAHDHHDDVLVSALNGGISSGNNDLVQFKRVEISMPDDAPWKDIALFGTWAQASSFQKPQVLMKPGGEVVTRGSVASGASTTCAVLEESYSPPGDEFLHDTGSDGTQLLVTSSGVMVLLDPAGLWANTYSLAARWIASPANQSLKIAQPHAFPAPWPIIVQHGWAKCEGLVIEACIEETGGEARGLAGAPIADWEDIGNGQLRLNAVWGLQWRRRYMLRLRLTAEEE